MFGPKYRYCGKSSWLLCLLVPWTHGCISPPAMTKLIILVSVMEINCIYLCRFVLGNDIKVEISCVATIQWSSFHIKELGKWCCPNNRYRYTLSVTSHDSLSGYFPQQTYPISHFLSIEINHSSRLGFHEVLLSSTSNRRIVCDYIQFHYAKRLTTYL